jgi:DNA-binding NtrC family response regulator
MTNYHRLLIADTNQILCWSLEKMLSDKSILIKTVNTGRDAISEAYNNIYNSAFLDINLPDMSGTDLHKYIRKISPKTKIIMMADNTLHTDRGHEIDGDPFQFILKPFHISDFRDIIDNIISEEIK